MLHFILLLPSTSSLYSLLPIRECTKRAPSRILDYSFLLIFPFPLPPSPLPLRTYPTCVLDFLFTHLMFSRIRSGHSCYQHRFVYRTKHTRAPLPLFYPPITPSALLCCGVWYVDMICLFERAARASCFGHEATLGKSSRPPPPCIVPGWIGKHPQISVNPNTI